MSKEVDGAMREHRANVMRDRQGERARARDHVPIADRVNDALVASYVAGQVACILESIAALRQSVGHDVPGLTPELSALDDAMSECERILSDAAARVAPRGLGAALSSGPSLRNLEASASQAKKLRTT